MFRFSRPLPGFVRVEGILPVKFIRFYRKMTAETVIDKRIPDKWRDYKPCGVPITGERIIAFKTPLSNRYDNESELDNGIKPHERFTPVDLLNHLNQKNIKLGMVVDFTNTNRYYDSRELFNHGILYRKIKCVGKEIPNDDVVSGFKAEACTFLAKNTNSDDLIGVHCTHGLNRAGYIVCRYLIECRGYTPEKAIEAFNVARGHPMERETYLDDLKKKTAKTEVSSHIQKGERRRGQDTSFDKPRHFHTSTKSFTRQERTDWSMARYSRHQNEYQDFKSHFHDEDRYQPIGSHTQSRNYASRRFSTNEHRDNNYHNFDNRYHNYDNNDRNFDNNYHNYDDFNYSRYNSHNCDRSYHNYNNYASYGYDDYQPVRNREGSYRRDHVIRNTSSSSRDRPKPYSHQSRH
ncbi:hypothetical protein ACROYT_G004265 [Oculina patagonica]